MPRSHLLDLPPELRDAIFEFALACEKTVVTFRLDDYQRDSYVEAVQPALTRVNRQIRHETLPIFYAVNEFVLHTHPPKGEDARRWLLCNDLYLLQLKRVSIWVRMLTPTTARAPSQGIISIAMQRSTVGCWKVDDHWRWNTVLRKPAAAENDARVLIRKLKQLLVNESTSHLSGEEFANLLSTTHLHYAALRGR